MVLADSCIWIDYLGGKASHGMELLLQRNEVATCGTVMAEVLSGVKSDTQRARLERRLKVLPYFAETRSIYLRSARMYAALRRKGKTVPLSDCTIAAICLEHGATLLTTDKHFSAFDKELLRPAG